MLSLWDWFIAHAGIIGGIVGGGIAVGVPSYVALRGQRETRRLAEERNRLDQQEQRRQVCVPLLTAAHEFAPVVAEFRKIHDDLWARQQLFLFDARSYVKRTNAFFAAANEKIALAASELSIDPAGQKVVDAFVAYLKAQDEYAKAMIKPMQKLPTRLFGKADTSILDEFAKKGDEKFTALEKAVRLYVDSPPHTDHQSSKKRPGVLLRLHYLTQISQRWRKGDTNARQVET